MVDVKRKRGETFDSLLRRFNRRLQLSGRVLEAKRTRFKKKQPNKNLIRHNAIRREEMKANREYMIKIGKLREEDEYKNKRK